jgi:hypothetical protein
MPPRPATPTPFYLHVCPPVCAGPFELRPPGLPADAHALHDPHVDAFVGYAHRTCNSVRILDLDGRCVSLLAARPMDRDAANALRALLRRRFAALLRAAPRVAVSPAHLRDDSRFVPAHILRLAIRYGVRSPDRAGHRGVSRYAAPLVRQGLAYRLALAVRDHDDTVLHVSYQR